MKHSRARARLFRTWLISALLAATIASSVSCSGPEPPEIPPRPVRTMRAVSTGAGRVRNFAGVTRAAMESAASFRVPGKVTRLPIKVGDTLERGDLIAQLDRTDFELQVQQLEAAVRQAQSAQRKAQSDYDRVKRLYENQNASRNDLDAARAGFESSSAQVESAQKQLELAGQQLRYTSLRAPIECAVASVLTEVNENVASGQSVALLTAGDELEVAVAIPEILIGGIAEGDGVEVSFDSIEGEVYPAVVTEVGIQPTGGATTFPVVVKLQTRDRTVRPGMAAEVSFRFTSQEQGERIYVPTVAVGEDRQGRFVFIVEESEPGFGVCFRRSVRVGDLSSFGIEIKEGIADGDVVVTAGVSKIEDGLRVRLPGAGD